MRGEAQARGWQGRLRTHLGDARGARESVRALAELAASAPTLVSSGEESLLRGRLAELVGSRTEALELYRKALAAWRRSWSPLGQARAHLAMGRVLLRQDRRPEAIEHLDRACEVGEEAGAPAIQLPATIARAIADEDLEAAAALLHEREHELGPRLRLEFHFALHRAGAEGSHLVEAGRLQTELRDAAPAARRKSMLENVPLHRDVRAALSGSQ